MLAKSITPSSKKSRLFLAFIALLFSICLCIVSFQGGAFGAVEPLNVIATPWVTHLLMDEKGSEGFDPMNQRINQHVSIQEIQPARLNRYLRELDRMMASRLAVDRAA